MRLDLEPLYNVEAQVEPGLCRILSLNTGIKQAYPMFGDETLEGERIELKLTLGGETGEFYPTTYNGQEVAPAHAWNYSLLARVITTREGPNARARHSAIRTKVRVALLYLRNSLTTTELPNHQLVTVRHAGTEPHIETSEDQDVSDMTFEGVLGIRSTAWGDEITYLIDEDTWPADDSDFLTDEDDNELIAN